MKAVVVIGGRGQKYGDGTGSEKLYDAFRDWKEDTGRTDFLLYFAEWDVDWKKFAKLLHSHGVRSLFVAAYSWGAGHGLKMLAKHFRGKVRAVLADPVYHSKRWFMNWLAFFDRKIRYPRNVYIHKIVAQTEGVIDGDPVAGANDRVVYVAGPHARVDDSATYHQIALACASLYLNHA